MGVYGFAAGVFLAKVFYESKTDGPLSLFPKPMLAGLRDCPAFQLARAPATVHRVYARFFPRDLCIRLETGRMLNQAAAPRHDCPASLPRTVPFSDTELRANDFRVGCEH